MSKVGTIIVTIISVILIGGIIFFGFTPILSYLFTNAKI